MIPQLWRARIIASIKSSARSRYSYFPSASRQIAKIALGKGEGSEAGLSSGFDVVRLS
jgi:hypothetical protein